MVAIQSFRLRGKPGDDRKIRCQHLEGEHVVFWDDIVQIFPGVNYVEADGVAVSYMRRPDYSK